MIVLAANCARPRPIPMSAGSAARHSGSGCTAFRFGLHGISGSGVDPEERPRGPGQREAAR
jgi:hypothetical protein